MFSALQLTKMLTSHAGSDHGKFLCCRVGAFVSELNAWVVPLAFKARDMHTGHSPTTPPVFEGYCATAPRDQSPSNFFDLVDAAYTYVGAPNRMVFVLYFGTGACDRSISASIFPGTGFANSEMLNSDKLYPLNFMEHGKDMLGDIHEFNNRMARKLLYHNWNIAEMRGSRLNAAAFMKCYEYQDEDGNWHSAQVPPWNPKDDEEYVLEMSRWYQHHRDISYEYLIPLRKPDLKKNKIVTEQEVILPTLQPLADVTSRLQPQSNEPTFSQNGILQEEQQGSSSEVSGQQTVTPDEAGDNISCVGEVEKSQSDKPFEYYDSQGESEAEEKDEETADENKAQEQAVNSDSGDNSGSDNKQGEYAVEIETVDENNAHKQGDASDSGDDSGSDNRDLEEGEYVVEKISDIVYDEVCFLYIINICQTSAKQSHRMVMSGFLSSGLVILWRWQHGKIGIV